MKPDTAKLWRIAKFAIVNLSVLLVLFLVLELSYRIYRDGIPEAFTNIANYFRDVPYSSIGTGQGAISDEILGYRLNPAQKGVNSLSTWGDEIAVPKPTQVYRIIFLGDSVLAQNPGLVDYTRDRLPQQGKIEVINAAVPGYTTYQELMFLKTYLLATSPDLVILGYVMNDNHKFLHRFDAQGRLLVTNEAAESLKVNSIFDLIVSRSYVLTRIKVGLEAMRRQPSPNGFSWESREDVNTAWKDESWEAQEEYLKEMQGILIQKGGKLAVVIFPFEPQLDDGLLASNYNYTLKPQRELTKICDRHAIPCLDLFQEFHTAKQQGVKLYTDGIHLTDEGHRLAAALIYRFLGQNALYPLK
jgi:lysophospholipase L1-like esterase